MRRWVLHPLIFAVVAIGSLYHQNVHQTDLAQVVPSLLVVMAATALVFGIAWAIFRNARKVGVPVSVAVILFFLFGAVHGLFHTTLGIRRPALFVAATFALILLAVIIPVFRTKRRLDALTLLLNLAAIGTLLVICLGIVSAKLQNPGAGIVLGHADLTTVPKGPAQVPATMKAHPDAPLPDVYVIIPDRYTNAAVLREVYGYDNEPFLAELRKRGFFIQTGAWANYPRTGHSIASTLHMDYLDPPRTLTTASSAWQPICRMMRANHPAAQLMASRGYHYVHAGSWYYPTTHNDHADVNLNAEHFSEFSWAVVKSSAIYPLLSLDPGMNAVTHNRNRVLHTFSAIASLEVDDRPKFVLAHFLVPHPPYLFDRDGTFPDDQKRTGRSSNENYIRQLEFVNGKLLEMIDAILARSKRPAVIILQSDEGPFPERMRQQAGHLAYRTAERQELREKMGILCAYRLPGRDPERIPPDVARRISPINTFRLIGDLYLGTEMGLLDPRHLAFEDERHLYTFFDVSEALRPANGQPASGTAPH